MKTYTNKEVKLEDNLITFSGKHDQKRSLLTVTNMQGDVTLFVQAMQNFSIENGIIEVRFKF